MKTLFAFQPNSNVCEVSMSIANDQVHTAPTLFLLMAQYNGRTVVPPDQVCRDFFGHLTVEKLIRKALHGDIARCLSSGVLFKFKLKQCDPGRRSHLNSL